jgi:WS/DGAT/MGAT family acyltransferase
MKQLNAQDSQFLYMENSENLSNVVMGSIFAPPEKASKQSLFEIVKAHVLSRLHTSPIFTRRLVRVPLDLDFPYWADDEYFDIEGHLHLHRLPAPAGWAQFSDLMGRIHSRPLDMNRPLWEMHVVENLAGFDDVPEGSFALITKVHHSAVDGASMVKFFACLSDLDVRGTPAVDISECVESSGEPPTPDEMWKRFINNHLRSPVRMSQTLLRSAPTVLPAVARALAGADKDKEHHKVPTTRLNQKISPRKIFDAAEFDLDDFKLIQRAVDGAKINDVVLAVCSGAIRSYLKHHGELPEEPLVAWVPINTRPKDGKSGKGDSGQGEGNQITAMTTDLCTHMANPAERLAQITYQTQLSKAAKSGISARLMTDVSQSMPGATLALVSRIIIGSGVTAKLCNIAISNVPGPQMPLYMQGAKSLHQYGMTPLGEGMGLFFVALSYNGKITISMTSTREIIPDIAKLRGFLESSVSELKKSALAAEKKRSRKPSAVQSIK